MGKQLIDLTGQRFGRLTVIKQAPVQKVEYQNSTAHRTMWHCKCDCGESIIAWAINLTQGNTSSCGCLRREHASQRLKAAHKAAALLKEMGEKNECII